MTRKIVTTTAALAVACALVIAWWLRHSNLGWGGEVGTPTRLQSIGADVFFLNVPEIVRRGPPRLVVVRLDRPAAAADFAAEFHTTVDA